MLVISEDCLDPHSMSGSDPGGEPFFRTPGMCAERDPACYRGRQVEKSGWIDPGILPQLRDKTQQQEAFARCD
jgi:hypothetical protein